MLLRINPASEAERARREFAREKRSSAYMVVFSILFAFIVQSLAKWLYEQITLQPADLDKNIPVFVPYILIGLIFLFAVYFWLFFSRVLIYIEEDDFGEFLSFLLAGVILGIISTIRPFLADWPYLVSLPALLVALKLLHLLKRAKDPEDLPLKRMIISWAIWSFGVFAGLVVVGLYTVPMNNEKLSQNRVIVNTVVSFVLVVFGFIAVFKAAGKIQRSVEQHVETTLTASGTS